MSHGFVGLGCGVVCFLASVAEEEKGEGLGVLMGQPRGASSGDQHHNPAWKLSGQDKGEAAKVKRE